MNLASVLGSSQALKIRSREAAKRRLSVSSSSFTTSLMLVFLRHKQLIERRKAQFPDGFQLPEPFLRVPERRQLGGNEMLPAHRPASDQSRLLQDLDVLGNGVQGHIKMGGEPRHSQRPLL